MEHCMYLIEHEPLLAQSGPKPGEPKRIQVNPREHIPRSQLVEVRNAHDFAREGLKKPLNTYLVINFAAARGWIKGRRSPAEYRRVREKFATSLRNWFARNSLNQLWIYSDENPPEGGRGPHINLLLHLPPQNFHTLRDNLLGCLRFTGGWTQQHLQSKWAPLWIASDPLSPSDSERVLRYICKGASPYEIVETNDRRLILAQLPECGPFSDVLLKPQGNVATKRRAGSSRQLGESARQTEGWIERKDLEWMTWLPVLV
jgi:hypothetical protein